jgi:hypothetical protein
MLLDAWHLLHPAQPWTGQHAGGGLVGWANRLDERVIGRGRVQIAVQPRDLVRALVRSWLVVPVAALVVASVALPAPAQPIGFLVFAGYMMPVANKLRVAKRVSMRAEIEAYAAQHPEFASRPEVAAILHPPATG